MQGLEEEIQFLIAARGKPLQVAPGHEVCAQGDAADCVWLLHEGMLGSTRVCVCARGMCMCLHSSSRRAAVSWKAPPNPLSLIQVQGLELEPPVTHRAVQTSHIHLCQFCCCCCSYFACSNGLAGLQLLTEHCRSTTALLTLFSHLLRCLALPFPPNKPPLTLLHPPTFRRPCALLIPYSARDKLCSATLLHHVWAGAEGPGKCAM